MSGKMSEKYGMMRYPAHKCIREGCSIFHLGEKRRGDSIDGLVGHIIDWTYP